MSNPSGPIARSVSESSAAGNERSRVSVIEKSVTHLLVATKTLLETLTKWSRNNASEAEVSDVYVRLGYEFNIACRAFKSVGVETADLGPVPDLLRSILEETLSGEPSPAHLDRYLPQIRDIIVNLLQGLKRKQQKLRQKHGREQGAESAPETRLPSSSSSEPRPDARRQDSQASASTLPRSYSAGQTAPSTSARASSTRSAPAIHIAEQTVVQPSRPAVPESAPPVQLPPAQNQSLQPPDADSPTARRSADALAQLQRGGDLERRASRRFSAYQIGKHLGSAGAAAVIPPAQNSPVPNRGREVRDARESMHAVRTRDGQARTPKNKYLETSPPREASGQPRDPSLRDKPVGGRLDTPDGQLDSLDRPPTPPKASEKPYPTRQGTATLAPPSIETRSATPETEPASSSASVIRHPSQKASLGTLDSSTSGPRELTLFLQYKTRIKKFVLADGIEELSVPRLQLAFIEKFAWSTHGNGEDLPEIYIQDPVSGVRHELEDLADVKDRSVLVLNVDAVDEVKKHVDDGLASLKTLMADVRSAIVDQASVLQQVADKQQDAVKEMGKLAVAPAETPVEAPRAKATPITQLGEVQSMRRSLAVMRQTYTSWMADMKAAMTAVQTKADAVKTLASQQPSFPTDAGDATSGRAYVAAGKKTLNTTSESIVTRVEDLQDTVEDLRKDVVTRGVRPLPRQLETVNKELSGVTAELKKLQEYIRREKPTWTKIWKNELQTVYEDQNLLTYQEDLMGDLEADLGAAAETFALVEEATKQQNLAGPGSNAPGSGSGPGAGSRNASRNLNPAADPAKAKDSVLDEVKALRPNHETRLEAIERAERLRQKELEERRDGEFKRELSGFVDEGRLKKSGGVEEAERVRKVKDERMRKQAWERTGRGAGPADEALDADAAAKGAADALSTAGADAASPSPSPSSALDTADGLPDLSTLAGSGLPPLPSADKAGGADSADTPDGPDTALALEAEKTLAEAATVPAPLEPGHAHAPGDGPPGHDGPAAGQSPPAAPSPGSDGDGDADFVEASELPVAA